MANRTKICRREALLATGSLFALLGGCTSPNGNGQNQDSQNQKKTAQKSKPNHGLNEQAIRDENIANLKKRGFTVSAGLPLWSKWTGKPIALRPTLEICRRLMCSEVATAYIWSPSVPEKKLRDYIERSDLMKSMAEAERKILGTTRKDVVDKFGNGDGWRQENQWGLAWVLGFAKEPGLQDGFIDEKVMTPLVQDFMPTLDQTDKEFAEQVQPRPLNEVFRKFDLFYCGHNAVRSAQLGRKTVPGDFDPVVDGGVVHEKRHSLTWCLSPGVNWDDTDLST